MNLKLVKTLMPEMYEQVVQGKCPFCHKQVTTEMFEGRDALTLREYHISGICPKCQDDFFK